MLPGRGGSLFSQVAKEILRKKIRELRRNTVESLLTLNFSICGTENILRKICTKSDLLDSAIVEDHLEWLPHMCIFWSICDILVEYVWLDPLRSLKIHEDSEIRIHEDCTDRSLLVDEFRE